MIRVLHLITALQTGGAEMMLLKLLRAIDNTRFASSVISLREEGVIGQCIAALQVPVSALNLPRALPSVHGTIELVRLVRRIEPHIVQGWMYHGNLAASFAARASRSHPPVLWNIRQSMAAPGYERPLSRVAVRVGAALSNGPARILYNSDAAAAEHEAYGFSAMNRVVIPNGVDLSVFRRDENARRRVRQELSILPGQTAVGMIARFHPIKDHGNFLRAAAMVKSEHADTVFVLAGTDVDAENPEITRMLHMNGICGNVRLLGERHDIAELLSGMDLLVVSSASTEGFPNVLIEAMACEVPCVATSIGDSPSILRDVGSIVAPKDSRALADAIIQSIRMQPAAKKTLTERGKRLVIDHYSIDRIAQHYETVYDRVAAG